MQKLIVLPRSEAIDLFNRSRNIRSSIAIACNNSFISTSECDKLVSFCFEISSNLLNENENTLVGKHFQWEFEVHGAMWSVDIFPSGINRDYHGYTSIFLYRQSELWHCGENGKQVINVYFSFDYDSDVVWKHDFSNGDACGFYKWREYKKHSTISVRFVMMCSFQGFQKPLSKNIDKICFKDTKPGYTNVLFTKPYDIEFKGEGWTYYFHRELLSAKSNCVTTPQSVGSITQEVQTINVPNVSSSIMHKIIWFIMKGSFQLEIKSLEEVNKAAVCLGLTDLKLACEFMILLTFSLIKNSVLNILEVAYVYNLKIIKYKCLSNMVTNLRSTFVLPDWEIRCKNCPNILLDLTKHLALTTGFKNKPDVGFCGYSQVNGTLSPILSCSKTVLNAYDVSNEQLSAVIVKLTFEISLDKLNRLNVYSFLVEETKWSLLVFTKTKYKDYVSVCLCNESTGEASVDFMLDCNQDIAYFHRFIGQEKWAFPKWKLTSDLPGGLLTVNFVMRQMKHALKQRESGEKLNSIYRFSQPLDEIPNLSFMIPDLLLTGDGWEYNVQRELLTAQSPVFHAMFSHDTKENKEKTINIDDISSDTMKQILSFLYTGRIEICDESVTDICAAADKYLLDSIKLACEHVLCNTMTVETVADRYICADMYKLAILKSVCIDFIINNFVAVTQTEGWVHLTNQKTLIEKLLLFISESRQITSK